MTKWIAAGSFLTAALVAALVSPLLLVQAFFVPQTEKTKEPGDKQHLPNTTAAVAGMACAAGGLPQVRSRLGVFRLSLA